MEQGESPPESFMKPVFGTSTGNVLHHDERNLALLLASSPDGSGDSYGADVRQRFETFRFARKHTGERVGIRFEKIPASILQTNDTGVIDTASARGAGRRDASGATGLFLDQFFDGGFQTVAHTGDSTGRLA